MNIKVATSQFATIKDDFDSNLNKAIKLIEDAAKKNVDILLLQELFLDNYFCSTKNDKFFNLAIDFPSNPMFEKLSNICKNKLKKCCKKPFLGRPCASSDPSQQSQMPSPTRDAYLTMVSRLKNELF